MQADPQVVSVIRGFAVAALFPCSSELCRMVEVIAVPQIPVERLRTGDVLEKDVFTSRNNMLLPAGTRIDTRELEILHAFQIAHVFIADRGTEKYAAADLDVSEIDRNPWSDRAADKEEKLQTDSYPQTTPSTESGVKVLSATANLPFNRQYVEMVALLKRAFQSAARSTPVPIVEIRIRLGDLLEASEKSRYNPMTFSTGSFVVDDYMYHSGVMGAMTAHQLAKWHKLPKSDWFSIALGALFRDIGNVEIDAGLLRKPVKLMDWEREEMKKHTVHGYRLLRQVPDISEEVRLCALQHHERLDGSGYPLGLTGDKIHLYAKVVAIADIFHAMTSKRVYQNKKSPYVALEQLHDDSFGKLDAGLVLTFIRKLTGFHQGTVVRLSDRSIGEIVFTEPSHPTRPWVKVNDHIINLSNNRSIHIEEVLKA